MIKLYTLAGCPKCAIIHKKLTEKNIEFTECRDISEMQELGITQCPVLSVDGALYKFAEANKWVNEKEN